MIAKTYLIVAASMGMLSVMLGAFAAHGLKGKLSETLLHAFQTGVQYLFFHALALLAVAILLRSITSVWLHGAGALFIAGALLFSGSLFGLALGGPSWFGPVTPLGGLCFILGWAALIVAAVKI